MLMGEYHHTLDEKGRIIIPSKFREELRESFIITRGIEHCLYAYKLETFEKIVNRLEQIPFTKKDARCFTRFFLSGATNVEYDKQGRVNIPEPLINYANLTKECIIIGSGERLEIWSKECWDNFFNSTKDTISSIAENIFNDID